MINFKMTLLALTVLISAPIFGAERPPQPKKLSWETEATQKPERVRQRINGLPGEVQREILNTYFAQAYPNLKQMAERIIEFKDTVTAGSMLQLFQIIRNPANTNVLAWHLKELPIMQDQKIKDWLEAMSNSSHLYVLMCSINEPGHREKIFNILKNKKIYLNARSDSGGQTPLIQAIYMKDGEIVAALLAAGADPDGKDDLEWTALMLAANKGLIDIGKLLIAAHANVNIQDAVGYSPLILAASHGHQEIVESLLAAGADPELKSFKDNKSAEDFARKSNHFAVAKILADASAKRKIILEKKQ